MLEQGSATVTGHAHADDLTPGALLAGSSRGAAPPPGMVLQPQCACPRRASAASSRHRPRRHAQPTLSPRTCQEVFARVPGWVVIGGEVAHHHQANHRARHLRPPSKAGQVRAGQGSGGVGPAAVACLCMGVAGQAGGPRSLQPRPRKRAAPPPHLDDRIRWEGVEHVAADAGGEGQVACSGAGGGGKLPSMLGAAERQRVTAAPTCNRFQAARLPPAPTCQPHRHVAGADHCVCADDHAQHANQLGGGGLGGQRVRAQRGLEAGGAAGRGEGARRSKGRVLRCVCVCGGCCAMHGC